MTRTVSNRRFRTPGHWVLTAVSLALTAIAADGLAGQLHDAVVARDLETVEDLLRDGAPVDESDFLLGTALHRAAVVDAAASAEVLIIHGADVEAASEQQGSRPLHLAADAGSVAVLTVLVDALADLESLDDLERRPLSRAAAAGQAEAVSALVEAGAGIEALSGPQRRTALIEAANNGRVESARLLLEWGAEVNAQDERGKTALWYAATPESLSPAGGPKLIELLTASGADLEAADSTGMTPLAWARARTGSHPTYSEIEAILTRLGATK